MIDQPEEAGLAAYALGEADAPEAGEAAARVASDPAAREAVEEIRQVAEILREELLAEPAPELTGAQRGALLAAAARRDRRLRFRRPGLRIGLAVAAVVLAAVGVGVFWDTILPKGPARGPEGAGVRPGPPLVGTPGDKARRPAPVGTPDHSPRTAPTTRPQPDGTGPTTAPANSPRSDRAE